MSESSEATTKESRRRWKDVWTLHVPLVIVLGICTYATINQYNRAMEGVDRSWVYMVEWPLIGLFAVFVWNRYRKHGNFSNWFTRYYRERAERFEAEAEAKERAEQHQWDDDPDAQAWQAYVEELHREDPPGGPPERH